MKILYQFIYLIVGALLGLKHVLRQLRTILWSEACALLGKAPNAAEMSRIAKKLKHFKHLGCILDHTHFGRNGILFGETTAQLATIAVAADSSHTSIFLPRRLLDSEKEILKGMILKQADSFINQSSKSVPHIKFYESVYATLSNESFETEHLDRIAQMAKYRRERTASETTVQSTSWGISGDKLTNLTDFENAFAGFNLVLRTEEKSHHAQRVSTEISPTPTHRILFLSPLDGKDAVVRVAQLLSKALKQGKVCETDIDQALVHALLSSPEGELWPSPDLVMNFKDTPTSAGYPGWLLRYAELVNAGTLDSGLPLVWERFHGALCTFSKTVQRFGK